MSIPTLLLIKNKEVVAQQIGAIPKPMIKNMIEKAL